MERSSFLYFSGRASRDNYNAVHWIFERLALMFPEQSVLLRAHGAQIGCATIDLPQLYAASVTRAGATNWLAFRLWMIVPTVEPFELARVERLLEKSGLGDNVGYSATPFICVCQRNVRCDICRHVLSGHAF